MPARPPHQKRDPNWFKFEFWPPRPDSPEIYGYDLTIMILFCLLALVILT